MDNGGGGDSHGSALRCFLAVKVPAAVRRELEPVAADLGRQAREAGLKVSWTRPEGWHVTLRFLGEVATGRIEALSQALAAALRTCPPLEVAAHGLFTLPPKGKPRVLAVAMKDGGGLAHMAANAQAAVEGLGFKSRRRPFRPHLTLARIRGGSGWRDFAPLLTDLKDRGFGRGGIDEAHLFSSRLTPEGARYESLVRFRLEAI
mgnify:CR=1 FL=1